MKRRVHARHLRYGVLGQRSCLRVGQPVATRHVHNGPTAPETPVEVTHAGGKQKLLASIC
jgi:hypothetical protein